MACVDTLADMWVSLAADQRNHGSHLRGETNRGSIRAAIDRHVVSDNLRVAREDERVLGFVMFAIESNTLDRSLSRGLIENLYVVEDRRREGMGTTLLQTAEESLRREGVDAIALEVLAPNEGARAFYRDHGYTPHRLTLEKSIESDTHSKDDE